MVEEVDEGFNIEGNCYTIKLDKDRYILKRYYVEKAKKLLYAFIGGMWYSKNVFSLEQDISLPYPFSTYYTFKILDKKCDDELCRSLLYVKMPLIVLQFEDKCIAIEFDPLIKINGKEIFPFISLSENKEHYIITFYLFKEFEAKEKESAWLGVGKRKRVVVDVKPGDVFRFSVNVKQGRDWREMVLSYVREKTLEDVEVAQAEKVFEKGKKALWRSYDNVTGSFLQLPWRDVPGFTFVNSSYSLLTYEAVRLHYFTRWFRESGDEVFRLWAEKLRNLFVNPRLYKKDLRHGEGVVWYNMTNLARNGLQGFFYMDCGYSGYPGGQASTAFHLLQYLKYEDDEEINGLVKLSLEYILSTQKENGSWPMALHQEDFFRFRPEKLEEYESFSGTSECVRALISGYERFKEERFKKAALKGLEYLETRCPICYNGLRDIGLNEAEAFSAVTVVDAFLDAYGLTGNKRFLENALNYACYILTWFYMYDTKNLRLKYNFHPISFSITPRLSPYESVWVVSTFMRLFNVTKDDFWKNMAKLAYVEAVKWRSRNGGLSEGVFPYGLKELKPLPMEQTFATVEMLNASTLFFGLRDGKGNRSKQNDGRVRVERKGSKLFFLKENIEIMVFDLEGFKVLSLHGVELNHHGISFSFSDGYSPGKRLKGWFKHCLRGRYGKFLLGLGDVKYFLKGVKSPKVFSGVKLDFLGDHLEKTWVSISNDSADVTYETGLHRINLSISVAEEEDEFLVFFDPFVVETLKHDVSCKQVLFPVVGAKLVEKKDDRLCFNGFEVVGDFKNIVESKDFTGVDQTLSTNWTHGGVYKGGFTLVLKKRGVSL